MKAIGGATALMALVLGVQPGSFAFRSMIPDGSVSNGPLRHFSVRDYSTELDRLEKVVAGCKAGLDAQTPTTCDSALVGADAVVSLAGGERTVSYNWLRRSLRSAAAGAKTSAERATRLTALSDCNARLQEMATEIAAPPRAEAAKHTAEVRKTLDAIFARGGFFQAKPPPFWQEPWQEFLRWLMNLLRSVMPSNPSRAAIRLMELCLIAIPFCLLTWWVVRRLRRQKPGLSPATVPHPSAPSAQDWESWLDAGQRFALEGRWRDAIHHVYWSAIAFLELQRDWPADRTRTPREYLGLLDAAPEKRNDLGLLTKSFEHTWYGGRAGAERDYKEALRVLARITAS